MKKLISLLLALSLLLGGLSAFAEEQASTATTLVVYFSHAGENYNVGVIEEGNTARMGKIIAEQMNADVFELVPVVPYLQFSSVHVQPRIDEKKPDFRLLCGKAAVRHLYLRRDCAEAYRFGIRWVTSHRNVGKPC